MRWYLRLARRLRAILLRSRLEREMNAEMRVHLEMQIEDNLRAGMDPATARREALKNFGALAKVRDECRDERGSPLLESILQDLRHGLRMLARKPGFAAVVLLILAAGIGANTAMFSVVDAVLLRPLPFRDPERLVMIWENDRLRKSDREAVSLPDFLDIQSQAREYSGLAAYQRVNRTITGEGEPERLPAARAGAGIFEVLGVDPVLGRTFTAQEGPRTVIIGHGLWQRRYGGAASALGRTIVLDGLGHTIIGVLPAAATDALAPLQSDQLWMPLDPTHDDLMRGRHVFRAFGRLKPGSSIERAQAEIDGIMARLETAYPGDNQGRGAFVIRAQDQLVNRSRRALYVLLGAVGLVLLAGCANVASLLLAQLTNREREIAVRASLGAGRGRVLRQLLTESLLIAVLGGALGILLAHWFLRGFVSLTSRTIPRLEAARLDPPVLAFALGVSVLTAVIFGLLPALSVVRGGVHDILKSGGRTGTATTATRRLRRALVVAEVALSLTLLAGAGLLLKAFWRVHNADPGCDPAGILTATLELPASRYPYPKYWPIHEWPAVTNLADRIAQNLRTLPGVESATLAVQNPLMGGWTTRVTVVGRPEPPPGEQDEAEFSPVDCDYFRTMRAPLRRGRHFTAGDDARHPLAAIVNEAFVRRHFPGEDPLGRQIRVYGAPREIVGVAADIRLASLTDPAPPTMYLPYRQNPIARFSILLRGRVDGSALRRAVWSEDRDLALFDVGTLQAGLAETLAQRRVTTVLLASFAAVALLLAAAGIYGVVSYSVAQRTREIGIRIAVGARQADIVHKEIRGVMAQVALGVAIGVAAALALGRALSTLVFDVSTADPPTFAAVSALLAATALAAAYLPARRASRVDPSVALRHE